MCDQIFEMEYIHLEKNPRIFEGFLKFDFSANFDLIISPVSLSDDALYQCQVILLEILRLMFPFEYPSIRLSTGISTE